MLNILSTITSRYKFATLDQFALLPITTSSTGDLPDDSIQLFTQVVEDSIIRDHIKEEAQVKSISSGLIEQERVGAQLRLMKIIRVMMIEKERE